MEEVEPAMIYAAGEEIDDGKSEKHQKRDRRRNAGHVCTLSSATTHPLKKQKNRDQIQQKCQQIGAKQFPPCVQGKQDKCADKD